jgi:hypothetical protein
MRRDDENLRPDESDLQRMSDRYAYGRPVLFCPDAVTDVHAKTSSTSPTLLATTEQPRKKRNYGWLWWLLGAAILGGVVALIIWAAEQNRRAKEKAAAAAAASSMSASSRGNNGAASAPSAGPACSSSDQCAALCAGAKFPCVASCDKGRCQMHALGCIGPNKAWCASASRCIDTTSEMCPAGNGNGNGSTPAVAAPAGMAALAMKQTADAVQGIIARGQTWTPTAAGERVSQVAGRPVRLDSAGNMQCMDSMGHWWQKGTGQAWWWRDPSTMAVVKKVEGVPRMWKQEASGMHLARPLGTLDSQWMPCPQECSMEMDDDVAQARAVVSAVVEMDGGASTGGLHSNNNVNTAQFADTGCGGGSWRAVSTNGVGLPRFVGH